MPVRTTNIMNKLTIPSILAATVLIAGIFAFMPVEKASTVHTGLGTQLTTITNNVATLQADVDILKMELDTVKDNTGAPVNRTLTLTDDDMATNNMYTLSCFSTAYVLEGINADISGAGATATFTLMQTNGDITGTGVIQFDDTETGSKDLISTSPWIGGLTDEDIIIDVTGVVGTDPGAVIKVTIQAPSTVVCSLTETT